MKKCSNTSKENGNLDISQDNVSIACGGWVVAFVRPNTQYYIYKRFNVLKKEKNWDGHIKLFLIDDRWHFPSTYLFLYANYVDLSNLAFSDPDIFFFLPTTSNVVVIPDKEMKAFFKNLEEFLEKRKRKILDKEVYIPSLGISGRLVEVSKKKVKVMVFLFNRWVIMELYKSDIFTEDIDGEE